MRHFLILLLLSFFVQASFAQAPEQDCFNALPVCQNVFTQSLSYSGTGSIPNEINLATSCLGSGEKNDVWYIFTVQTAGNLCFNITPNNLGDDYDWAVYNLTNNPCNDIYTNASLEVGCNYSGTAGITGANGSTGAQNEPCIPVSVGETYVLNVSNFSSTQSGYTLDFSSSTAVIFDNIPPTMNVVNTPCASTPSTTYNITFSENVKCVSVDPLDFTVTTPSGNTIAVTGVTSAGCLSGAGFSNTYTITLASLPTESGLYSINLVGTVQDNCDNIAAPASQNFVVPFAGLEIVASDTFSCGSNPISLSTNFPSSLEPAVYQWQPNNSTADSLYFVPTANQTYTVTVTDVNGCVYTASQLITQVPGPIFDFALDKTAVCGNNYATLNPIFTSIPSGNVPFWNFANPALLSIVNGTDDYLINWGVPGTKTISLYFKDINYDCYSDTIEKTVEVLPVPKTSFDDRNICLFENANFANLSTISSGSIVAYSWTTTNNVSFTTQDFSYLYPTFGTHDITLYSMSDMGCGDTLTKTIEVYPVPDTPMVEIEPICPERRAIFYTTSSPYNTLYWYADNDTSKLVHVGHTFQTDSLDITTTYYLVAQEIEHQCRTLPIPFVATVHPENQVSIQIQNPIQNQFEIPDAQVNFAVISSLINKSYDWDFGDGTASVDGSPIHTYETPGRYNVIVDVTDQNGCETRAVRPVEILKVVSVSVPSAFTPNGDAYNSVFTIGFHNVREFEFHVFDRWGRLVFETTDFNVQWDGKDKKGKDLPEGVYPYVIKAIGVDGNRTEKAGTITILR
ncbi:MAG: gliding motility-associated C-terminal domain-containing protein [Bacteroidia bacterium]